MKLCVLDLIGDEDMNWLDKHQQKDYPDETKEKRRTKWTEEERQKLKSLFKEFVVILRKYRRNFVGEDLFG